MESERAFNFAVFSEHAESLTLLLFGPADLVNPAFTYQFDFLRNKSGRVWHCHVPAATVGEARYYAYSANGEGLGFDPQKQLLDPYAHCIFFPSTFDRTLAMKPGSNAGRAPLGVIPAMAPEAAGASPLPGPAHHQSDAILYELHVRGFTKHPSSGVDPARAGTFDGLVEKIPYLKDLGVTIVELMPVYQRDPQDDDYWGYMPLNFFSAHHTYASRCQPCQEHEEFRDMVDALHAAGIEVILDVVYNHTAEGGHLGPNYSYKGLDNSEYYMMSGDPARPYANYSGTGNTLNVSSANVRQMILDSLRYWRTEMGVDGFRFDLASAFTRNSDGSLNWDDPPIIGEIGAYPDLRNIRLIAEPWDAAGAYQLGHSFPGITWLQWNGRFRDDVRRFVKGDAAMVPDLMRRLYGSDDFFPDDRVNAYHAFQSVNYITCHDGFTLYDLVAYNQKHNQANGENNLDGMDENYSWNCGVEGDTDLARSNGPAAAPDPQFLLPADALQRHTHVPRRRRVHADAARQQQPVQSGQRNKLAGLGPPAPEPGHFPVLPADDRFPQITPVPVPQPLLARGCALVWGNRGRGFFRRFPQPGLLPERRLAE